MEIIAIIMVCTAFYGLLIANTCKLMHKYWRQCSFVPAWTEWLLVVEIGCAATLWLRGIAMIAGVCLVVTATIGLYKATREEKRRIRAEIAHIEEKRRANVERMQQAMLELLPPQ